MQDPDPGVRTAAIAGFEHWQGDTATLVELNLSDPDAEVRARAAGARRWRPGTDVLDRYTAELRGTDPDRRSAAAEALATLRDEAAVPLLTATLDDPDPPCGSPRPSPWWPSATATPTPPR